jgi:hypothetical protein
MRKILAVLLLLTACKRNPVDRLVDPTADGVVPGSSGIYTIFDDEIKTGGGLGLIPGADNQTIDVTDQSAPKRSIHAIRYAWNGKDVYNFETGQYQHDFAGFHLYVPPLGSQLATASPKNLTVPVGYSKLKMFIRGSLSQDTTLRIEGPDDGTGGNVAARFDSGVDFTLTNDWQEITLAIPTGDFASVLFFLTISFQYNQPPRTDVGGDGGVIYLDDIRYEI